MITKVMARKRGITNIEMIIATTIFVFAVILVVYYISFIGLHDKPSEVFLNTLEQRLREECEIEYNVTLLSVKDTGNCFQLPKHFTMIDENNTTILSASGEKLNFSIDGNLFSLEKQGNDLVLIYTFPYNVTSHGQPSNCQESTNYDYGITSQGKIFVYEKLNALEQQLYGSLKGRWGFQKDFMINVSKANGEKIISVIHTKALEVPVLAKQFPIKVIDKDGNIFDANVNLQVW